MHPVVVTRPLAQAAPLAQRILEAGRDAVVFPLLDIQPLPDQSHLRKVLGDLGGYAMVAFVSPNAIDAAFGIVDEWPGHVAIAVMGEGSRAALSRHGIHPQSHTIISPRDALRTDSQTLLQTLDLNALRAKRVLIVRGESGRELLADAMRDNGVVVEQVAAYRRSAPVLDEQRRTHLQQLLQSAPDWIITSSEALRVLVDMTREVATETGVLTLQQQKIIVPHVRIAETARALGFLNVVQTGSGDEQLLAALQFQV